MPNNYARVRRRIFQLSELEPAPYNARSITNEALAGLSRSIEGFGLLALPVVNVADGKARLVGGHQRVEALRKAGVESVECVVVEFDAATERQANFALNNPHIEGAFVPELTRALLDEIAKALPEDRAAEIQGLRLDVLMRQVIRGAQQSEGDRTVRDGKTSDEALPAYSKSEAVSKVGTVYALGEHRLHCGGLQAPGSLEAFGFQRANATVTSLIAKQDLSIDLIDVILRQALSNTEGAIYVATSTANLPRLHARFIELGGHWSNTIVAFDPNVRSKTLAFPDATIPVLYGWPEGQAHAYYGGRDQGNVVRLSQRMATRLPVEVAVRAMLNSTVTGGLVLDPNADGGATVIAAEKTGRRVLGWVSTAREMDRVRRRWAEFVGGAGANWRARTKAVS